MKALKRIIIVIVCLVFIMIITCPDSTEHEITIKRELPSILYSRNNNSNSFFEKIGNTIGSFFGEKVANVVAEKQLVVENYYIVSIGKIYYLGKVEPVSIGMFNHVFLLVGDGRVAQLYREIK